MKARLLLGILLCFPMIWASPLPGDPAPSLAVPHPELYQEPKRPVGLLGLPLGTFAVIEGTEHQTGKFWGGDDFVIESINGKKVARELKIVTEWSPQFPDKRIIGKRYVLHGYERGKWEGQPVGLLGSESSGWTQSVGFLFQHIFVVTSVEKIDGVIVADAKPLDPKVSLAEPKIEDITNDGKQPPIGVLGLPLGTFAIIKAHTPVQPPFLMRASPFAVDVVNGRHLDKPVIITIPGAPATKGNERLTLHGFETGEWGSEPDLPKSENPSGNEVQQPFQFFREFVLTTPCKVGG